MKKQCSKCKRILDSSEFHKNKQFKDGLQYVCKECVHKDRTDLKREAMIYFGGQCVHTENGIQCSKNYIDDLDELDLSHPNNDGDSHRDLISNGHTGYSFYKALKDRGWGTDGFDVQIVCRSHHTILDHSGKKYNKSNLKHRKGKFNDPVWLEKKYETMTMEEIAIECGVSEGTIRNRIIEFKIERRKPGASP